MIIEREAATLTAVTVEPNSASPVWSTATGDAPPVNSTKMPCPPFVSNVENATAPRLLIEGCSKSAKIALPDQSGQLCPWRPQKRSPHAGRLRRIRNHACVIDHRIAEAKEIRLFVSMMSTRLVVRARAPSFSLSSGFGVSTSACGPVLLRPSKTFGLTVNGTPPQMT